MLYNSLKIMHIISASCVLTSIAYSFHLWRSIHPQNFANIAEQIQKQTSLIIIPFAMLQLATGFTMISVQRYNWQEFWISGSVISFIAVIISWFGFLYFLLLSQQVTAPLRNLHSQIKRYRRAQSIMLLLCAIGLLSMVFFMANKNG